MDFYRYRRLCSLLVFMGCLLFSDAALAQKKARPAVRVKRTYYDYQGRRLHEEFQYLKTPDKLEVKNGYYKEYQENGVIKVRAAYRNDELNGTRTTYENWGNGPEPFEIDNYRNGQRHGYSALWWFDDNDAGRRLKAQEGSYYNGKPDGRWVKYETDGSRLLENWVRGIRQGETVQYDAQGQKLREGYFEQGALFSGTIETDFDSGKPSEMAAYLDGLREGASKAWYPNGRLKLIARYVDGRQRGPILRYLENGEPDAATKAVLPTLATDSLTTKADSTRQAHEAVAAQVAAEARKIRAAKNQETTDVLREAASAFEDAEHLASMSESSSYSKPVFAHASIYNFLMSAYAQATADDDADKANDVAKRLLAAMKMTQCLYSGRNPELRVALSQEESPGKMLALMRL